MVEKQTLTNLQIYNYATALLNNFNTSDLNYPVKISFYLQKNIDAIVALAKEIEESRLTIVKKYGVPSEENPDSYTINPDSIDQANSELNDLLALTQEVSINMMKLDWFDGIDMTNAQVRAISFMISEE